jgi:hypothetical protein
MVGGSDDRRAVAVVYGESKLGRGGTMGAGRE